MPIAKLSIDLEARLAGLQAGLDKAGFMAAKTANQIEGAFKGLQSVLGGLGAGLAASISVAGLSALIRNTVDGIDKLNDLADATGDTVENLSALEDIAARTGTSLDTASDAVLKLNKALGEAAKDPSSDAARAIKNLGLEISDLLKLSPVERLQAVGKAMNSFDGENKLFYNLTLLGKGTRELAPLMKDLAEAGTLVATVTKQQAEEAEKFNKELFALQKSSTDAARAMTGPLISAINETIERFRAGAKEGKGFFRTLFEEQVKLLGLGKLLPNSGGATGSWDDDTKKPSLPALPQQKPPKPAASSRGSRSTAPDRAGIAGPPLDPQEAFRASELAQRALVEEALRVGQLSAMERDRADALKIVADQQARLDELLSATPTAQLEAARSDMLLLAAALGEGKIRAEQFSEAASTRLGNVAEQGKKAADEWSAFADQAARNIQDILGDTLESAMEGNFKSIGDLWLKTLNRMVAEALAANLGKALLGDFGKSGEIGGYAGEFFKFASTLFASARGNAFAGGVHAFAGGGIFGAGGGLTAGPTLFPMRNGGIGLAGEAGTEAIMPLKRGRGGRLGVEVAGGAGQHITITQHITAPPAADRASRMQLMADVAVATQRAIARNS